jgi:hypothetical protein
MELTYITEDAARQLVETKVEENLEKNYIVTPKGFANHLMDTGRIAYEVSNLILERHPSLKSHIDPDINRVEGYMHDFTKIFEGNHYHEIGTAHIVLTKGDSELGLVVGGTKEERTAVLKEIAASFAPDYALYEELGKFPFPNNADYKDKAGPFVDRLNYLTKALSKTGEPLTREEFALPLTLNQQITLYADLTNVGGKRVPVEQRLFDIKERYGDPEQPGYYDLNYVRLTDAITPRVLIVCNTIENLLR